MEKRHDLVSSESISSCDERVVFVGHRADAAYASAVPYGMFDWVSCDGHREEAIP